MKKEDIYYQVQHKDCEGIIVLVANSVEATLCCTSCKETWDVTIDSPFNFPVGTMKLGEDMYINKHERE